jgi:hypothetical protein
MKRKKIFFELELSFSSEIQILLMKDKKEYFRKIFFEDFLFVFFENFGIWNSTIIVFSGMFQSEQHYISEKAHLLLIVTSRRYLKLSGTSSHNLFLYFNQIVLQFYNHTLKLNKWNLKPNVIYKIITSNYLIIQTDLIYKRYLKCKA